MADGVKKKVLITGGAGGIGQAIVKRFCQSDFDVFIVDVQEESANKLLDEVSSDGRYTGDVCYVRCDLSDIKSTEKVVARLIKKESGIDVLINNAAVYPGKPLHEYTRKEYQTVQTINVEAGVVCTNLVIPHMKKNKWGRIVNMSSITAYGKFSGLMPYVVSKSALIGLTRALATELGEYGITVNGICPGAIPTEAEKVQGDLKRYNKVVLDRQALKRRGSVEDIANVTYFFASEDSSFVTGQMLNVDGGWVMH